MSIQTSKPSQINNNEDQLMTDGKTAGKRSASQTVGNTGTEYAKPSSDVALLVEELKKKYNVHQLADHISPARIRVQVHSSAGNDNSNISLERRGIQENKYTFLLPPHHLQEQDLKASPRQFVVTTGLDNQTKPIQSNADRLLEEIRQLNELHKQKNPPQSNHYLASDLSTGLKDSTVSMQGLLKSNQFHLNSPDSTNRLFQRSQQGFTTPRPKYDRKKVEEIINRIIQNRSAPPKSADQHNKDGPFSPNTKKSKSIFTRSMQLQNMQNLSPKSDPSPANDNKEIEAGKEGDTESYRSPRKDASRISKNIFTSSVPRNQTKNRNKSNEHGQEESQERSMKKVLQKVSESNVSREKVLDSQGQHRSQSPATFEEDFSVSKIQNLSVEKSIFSKSGEKEHGLENSKQAAQENNNLETITESRAKTAEENKANGDNLPNEQKQSTLRVGRPQTENSSKSRGARAMVGKERFTNGAVVSMNTSDA